MDSTLSSTTVDVVHVCAIRRGLAAMLDNLPGLSLSREISSAADYAQLQAGERAPVAFVSPRTTSDLARHGVRIQSHPIGEHCCADRRSTGVRRPRRSRS